MSLNYSKIPRAAKQMDDRMSVCSAAEAGQWRRLQRVGDNSEGVCQAAGNVW